jgi:hypothetical protein
MALKRFLLFTFAAYYPCGGWGDFEGDFDTAEEAIAAAKNDKPELYQVIDSETKKDVADNEGD